MVGHVIYAKLLQEGRLHCTTVSPACFFFFKQKTAYEMATRLEFRRVLFRSRRAESAVEAADLRTDLSELRVVSGDGEVAYHVQDVASADGVSRHHRNDGLGQRRLSSCRSLTWKRPIDFPPGVRRGASGSSRYPASPRTFWSPPEQKASGPSPVRMMTPVSRSSRASSR